MRRDSKIAAVLSAFFMPILRTNWAVDPEGVTKAKAVDLVAADLGLPVLGQKGPPPAMATVPGFHWGEHLRLALLHYIYGFFPFERWYNAKSKDGLTHLAGLDERLPHTIALIDLADNGQIKSVTQNTQLNPLTANRLLWYVNEREGANWAGVSMLRAAYTPWVLKHETMRVHATSIRRWGMGMPVVKAPPGGTPGQVSQAQQLASGMRAGDTAGVGLPDGFSVEIAGMTGSVPDALGFLNYCDQQIASAALAVFLELGLSSGGARALGDTFLDMFLLSLQAAADAIADTISYGVPAMPGIARALTDINFGEDEPCPRIVATDVGDRHEITATAIQQLVMCGAVQPDDGLEAFIRQAWDFPARTTPRTPPAPPKAPGAPGGPPNPAAPSSPNPAAPGPQPGAPRPLTGPPGRRGGQPATGPARSAGGPTAAAGVEASAGGGLRRPLTELEAAAGLDPEAMRADLETATSRVLGQWGSVLRAQRADLADQVAAAVDDGQLHQLAALQAPSGDAADVLYRAMAAVAARAAGRMVAEAAGQGVTINLADVAINHPRLRQLATARALMAGQTLATAASRRALQVVTATAGTDAAREVTAVLAGLSPKPLADQLTAAMHSAANEARFAVLDAGPGATYTATELADDPNCCQPCHDVDGHQFASLADARASYANGAYIHCLGGLRCRGTVVASWPEEGGQPAEPGWPHNLTPPPDLTIGPGVAAGFDPGERRDPHTGQWTGEGGSTARTLTRKGHGKLSAVDRLGAIRADGTFEPITAAEGARGDSRPVSMAEFQRLAAEGREKLARFRAESAAPAGLDAKWDTIKNDAWAEVQKPWGGATIDAHTGEPLQTAAARYALTVKPVDLDPVSVPEKASEAQFKAAMDEARRRFADQLAARQAYLGVFHDDDQGRIDIDPTLVVDNLHDVETIGAFTHAIGGAYNFADGNGYWPPHVAEQAGLAPAAAAKDDEQGKPVPFKGPGQWRTQADKARRDALKRLQEQGGSDEHAGPDTTTATAVRIDVTLNPGHDLPDWHQPDHGTLASAQDEIGRLRDWPGGGAAIREVVVRPKGEAAHAAADTPGGAWTVRYVFARSRPAFDPREARDTAGRWTSTGLKEALRLPGAHRIDAADQPGHAIIAFGDPATARHVVTYVPGVGDDKGLPGEARRALATRRAADAEHKGDSAVILWQGYHRPGSLHDALSKTDALGGAPGLAAFEQHLRQINPSAHQTVIGHSYGSVVAGEAARLHHMRPDDLVFVGSPGTTARTVTDLGMDPRHVWAGAHTQDPVARLAPVLSEDFHGSPTSLDYGAQPFAADTPGQEFPGVFHGAAHSSYWSGTSQALPNMAAIAAGDYGKVLRKRPAPVTVSASHAEAATLVTAALRQDDAAPVAAGSDFDLKHPRGYHGRFGHGVGPPRKTRIPAGLDSGDRKMIADQLTAWAKAEKDDSLKTALGMVATSYADGDYPGAAYRLRLAADRAAQLGRPLDHDQMNTIAGLIGKLGTGGGGEGYPGQHRDQISSHWRAETDPEAKQHLNVAGAAYGNNQYDQAADELREAAGRVGPLGRTADRDTYLALADAIEQEGQDNGISHAAQLLTAIGTETDATNVGTIADQLSYAHRVIEAAHQGTRWRSQAAGYLRQAADLARATGDSQAANRYENLAHRATHLPDEQAPGDRDVTALLARAAPDVPELLGGGDQRWNGRLGTFTKTDQPDYLGFTYPDGHIEFRTDVVNGLLDAQAHPGKVMPEPDNLDVVLHELIHDTTGGRTEQDKKDWAALPPAEQNALGGIHEMDQHDDPSGRGNPIARAPSQIQRVHLWITKAQLDSLVSRGLMEKTGTSSGGGDGSLEPDIRLAGKALRIMPHADSAADGDAYTSVTGHDIEEGFTELGSTQHMEQFAKDQGFAQVMTPRLSVAPLGTPPTEKQVLDVQDDLKTLYDDAGKVGGQPGSLEAYVTLSNAIHEMESMTGPDADTTAYAGYLAQAARTQPDPLIRRRINDLMTRLGITGGGTVDNPAYDRAVTRLIGDLQKQWAKLSGDQRPPYQQAAEHLGGMIEDLKADHAQLAAYDFTGRDFSTTGHALAEIQHLGDPGLAKWAIKMKAQAAKAQQIPAARHDTVPEYAHGLAAPAKLASSGSWGHYPILTANAQQWVQSIARSEHKTGLGKQGTAGYKRTVELADEINREGTAGKITAMARQVLRNQGIDPDTADPSVLADVRDEIIATYGDPSSAGHGAAAAYKAARRVARQRQQGYQRQGGTMVKFGAAADDADDEDAQPPVSATLTPAGAQAERIRAWAWHDPGARLDQARAQVRQLAEQTTDPAALRQVQDAGRSLATLAALRQPAAGPAAAFRPDEARDPHTGKWTGGPGSTVTARERVTGANGAVQPSLTTAQQQHLAAAARAAKKTMTPAQRHAVEQWTSARGMVHRIQAGQVSDATATAFDQAMHAAPKVDGLVYRGVLPGSHGAQVAEHLTPGDMLTIDKPVSTSADPRQAVSFGNDLYEIDSPAAAYVSGVAPGYAYEKEAVLAPGRYQVVSTETGKINYLSVRKTGPVRIIRLRDVTTGDRTWRPSATAATPAAAAPPGGEDNRAHRFLDGAGTGEFTPAGTLAAAGVVTADSDFERKHPRRPDGKFGHGPGGTVRPDNDQLITDSLYRLYQAEQDPDARAAVQQAGRAYADHDLPAAARALRDAAGHATNPGIYTYLAGRVEDRHAAQASEPARAIAVAGPAARATAAALDKALASGGEHDTRPGEDLPAGSDERRFFGNTADTAIVTYADGSKWVRKRGNRLHPFTNDDVNHEVAYARVARALGIPAPIAIKHTGPDGRPELYEPFVTGGIPAIEWTGGLDPTEGDDPEPGRDPAQLYDTREGRMIGLADSIAGTSERHLGNWLVVHDAAGDHPVPIDNNDATFGPVFGSITPFADFDPPQLAAETDADEWAQWQAGLEALQPEFAQLGMTTEWRNVMSNYTEAKRQAGET
jgi:hypothetical protein